MKRKIPVIYFFMAVVLAAGLYFLNEITGKKDNFSLSLRQGDSNLSAEYMNAKRTVDYYREQIEMYPDVIKNYTELAQVFIQEARITGDHHEYIKKASLLVETALKKEPDNFDALVTKASLLMTLHKFREAKEIIEKAVRINSFNAAALGILCDANVELGLYEDAIKACDKMLGIRPDLRSYSRASYLREIHGDIEGAIDAMTLAANSGITGQENRAWALYNLGSLYLQSGKADTAAFIFNGILEERPYFANAFSGLSDVFAAKKDYNKAIEYLAKAAQLVPEHTYIEKMADIYKALKQTASQEQMVKKVLQAFKMHKDEGYNIDLEYARFCLDHDIDLKKALESAEREYKIRPGNIDVLDIYAWALFKNNKAGEAVPVIEKAMRLNTKRSSIFYHAGIIYKNLNRHSEAVKYFKMVFSNNSYVNPAYAENVKDVSNLLAGKQMVIR